MSKVLALFLFVISFAALTAEAGPKTIRVFQDKSFPTDKSVIVYVEEFVQAKANCKIYFEKTFPDKADFLIAEETSTSQNAHVSVYEEKKISANADVIAFEVKNPADADRRVYGTSDLILAAAACLYRVQ